MDKWKRRLLHLSLISLRRMKLWKKGIRGPAQASISPAMEFLIKHFDGKSINVLEIGTRFGDSSEMILKSLNVKKFYVVDPYETYDDYRDDGFYVTLENSGGDALFKAAFERLSSLTKGLTFLRCRSDNPRVFATISKESLDLVFIDGNHEYDYVLKDLTNYLPLMKSRGILCGDDFQTRRIRWPSEASNLKSNRPMVFEAVCDFASKTGLTFITFGEQLVNPKVYAFVINRDSAHHK